MTIHEIYDRSIKTLPVQERLRLARLILDDAVPDEPPITAIDAQRRFEELVQEGLNSPAVELTEHVWDFIKSSTIVRED